ncbi:MAG: RNA polymerase sigma-70 factor [Bacteroidota bacterium]
MEELENQIIRGLRSGCESSYKHLFKEYYIVLSVFATRYVNDMETAKEIVQDLFVHLFEIRDSLTIKTSLKSFLFQSVKNRCLNHITHIQLNEKHIENLKTFAVSNNSTDDIITETELEHKIFQQVAKLPRQCQKIFKLSRVDGKKNQEIAEAMNISKRTVETQISKALKTLRKNLKDYL